MRFRSFCTCLAVLASLALPSRAQDAAPWTIGDIKFGGLVDGYYTVNTNHPASGTNGMYNFNVKANQFSLNMAKFSLSHSADPIGFQLDLGFGRAFDMIHAFEPSTAPQFMRNIEQAYVSWKPEKTGGLQLDFGKFVTSAGAEVIESHANWNYSRSLLFSWAIPYYHFGLRATQPWGKHFTGGVQLVNGWNNVEDTNSGKTIGVVGNFTSSKLSWMNNYYTGPEKSGTNKGFRNLYDTTVLLTPNSKFSGYFNFDYGRDKNVGLGYQDWIGWAIAAKGQITSTSAIAIRGESFNDRDGFNTGVAQTYREITATYEYKWAKGLMSRLEYRRDWAEKVFFERGNNQLRKEQNTFSIGIIGYFGN